MSDPTRRDPPAQPADRTDPGEPEGVTPRRPFPWVLAAVGIVAGALIGLAAGTLVGGDDEDAPSVTLAPVESPYPDDQAANAEALLDAWQRYRDATFVTESRFARRLPQGQQLETTLLVVQQPPRRVVRQAGSVSVIDADSTLTCAPAPSDTQTGTEASTDTVCTQRPSVDYDATVTAEIEAWRTAIGGDAPIYAVTATEDGCFELQLVTPVVAPPYGDATRLCFDTATGALRSREVVRADSTDTEAATRISGTVTDDDWAAAGG